MDKGKKLEIINDIKRHLGWRGIGHTYSIINGAKSNDAVVIVTHIGQEHYISQMAGKKMTCIPLDRIHDRLRGTKKPIVIDNDALSNLLDYAFDIINDYQAENNLLKGEIREYEELIRKTTKLR